MFSRRVERALDNAEVISRVEGCDFLSRCLPEHFHFVTIEPFDKELHLRDSVFLDALIKLESDKRNL